jgi:hypothetical protein
MLTVVEPRVRIEVLDCRADGEPGRWRVSWNVHNVGSAAVMLQGAWIPHGRFRGDGRLPLANHLESGQSLRLEYCVSAREDPGTRVDNAFLILQAASDGGAWRIFTRMRIEFDARAVPTPIVEAITTQPMADGSG